METFFVKRSQVNTTRSNIVGKCFIRFYLYNIDYMSTFTYVDTSTFPSSKQICTWRLATHLEQGCEDTGAKNGWWRFSHSHVKAWDCMCESHSCVCSLGRCKSVFVLMEWKWANVSKQCDIVCLLKSQKNLTTFFKCYIEHFIICGRK